ncbi:MAG: hypothetical protein JF886_02620 [Candidatus Dormibacteraeota bacterium]|uniref:DUF1049 domain-containing protein n=1 Tax=Candidatus Aeolococcus gillhamiae TaxID=3127015 RepID=A0A934N4D7_9BACT|nr:hypothetical protein [Candidatus Dormibacteraeota bacterium]
MATPSPVSGARREFRGTGLYWSLFVALILAVAILIGIIQNGQSVELKYLGWDLRTPLIVVLLVTVLASLVSAPWQASPGDTAASSSCLSTRSCVACVSLSRNRLPRRRRWARFQRPPRRQQIANRVIAES